MKNPGDRGRDMHGEDKVRIGLSIRGQVLAEVGLSRMEFEMIRHQGVEEALRCIITKDPRLSGDVRMVSLIMEEIKAGRYMVREAGEMEENT
jgi:hypothetical protein